MTNNGRAPGVDDVEVWGGYNDQRFTAVEVEDLRNGVIRVRALTDEDIRRDDPPRTRYVTRQQVEAMTGLEVRDFPVPARPWVQGDSITGGDGNLTWWDAGNGLHILGGRRNGRNTARRAEVGERLARDTDGPRDEARRCTCQLCRAWWRVYDRLAAEHPEAGDPREVLADPPQWMIDGISADFAARENRPAEQSWQELRDVLLRNLGRDMRVAEDAPPPTTTDRTTESVVARIDRRLAEADQRPAGADTGWSAHVARVSEMPPEGWECQACYTETKMPWEPERSVPGHITNLETFCELHGGPIPHLAPPELKVLPVDGNPVPPTREQDWTRQVAEQIIAEGYRPALGVITGITEA